MATRNGICPMGYKKDANHHRGWLASFLFHILLSKMVSFRYVSVISVKALLSIEDYN